MHVGIYSEHHRCDGWSPHSALISTMRKGLQPLPLIVRVLICYLSQILSLQIFWPLTLNFSPSGAKPNVKFLWIFENCSHVGLLSLLQVKQSMFVQPSPLRTVSKSLTILISRSIWECGCVFFQLCDKYFLHDVYWQGIVPVHMSEQNMAWWDCVFQLIWKLCFYWCNQRLHELFLQPCQAVGLFLAVIN